MFFSHDSNPKQNKRTECHMPEMLYELPEYRGEMWQLDLGSNHSPAITSWDAGIHDMTFLSVCFLTCKIRMLTYLKGLLWELNI